jgi:hypothetical protein
LKNNILTLLLLLVVTPKTFSQVPFWCSQVSVTYEVVDNNLILKGFNTENMENATDTTTFVFNINNGPYNITDTCFTYPNDSVIFNVNKNEIFNICHYTLIYADYPNILSHTCPVSCVNMVWDGIELNEVDETVNIEEISNLYETPNSKIYDINGRQLKNIENIPYGSIYIKDGKKHYKN